ncbi:MAG: hypothetical protein OEX82_05195 [Nitrosomonas sp.]|nr:hypothetical protein [Nitrosomonas sp.]
METMTFLVNASEVGHSKSAVWVTIKEIEGGALSFNVNQSNSSMGELRGVFFDIADASILGTLRVNAASNDLRIGNDAISYLENGTDMSGSSAISNRHSVAIDAGESAGNRYSFTLSSNKRDLTLRDFTNIQLDHAETKSSLNDSDEAESYSYSHNWLYMGLA